MYPTTQTFGTRLRFFVTPWKKSRPILRPSNFKKNNTKQKTIQNKKISKTTLLNTTQWHNSDTKQYLLLLLQLKLDCLHSIDAISLLNAV